MLDVNMTSASLKARCLDYVNTYALHNIKSYKDIVNAMDEYIFLERVMGTYMGSNLVDCKKLYLTLREYLIVSQEDIRLELNQQVMEDLGIKH